MFPTLKNRYRNIVLILACIIYLPLASFAMSSGSSVDCPKKKKTQKDSLSISESEKKVLIVESQIPDKKPVVKTDIPIRTTHKTFEDELEESKGTNDDPNSAMSFNFIYYIIDKFKFTDPLE